MADLTKAHLHVHFEGATRASTIAELAASQGRVLPMEFCDLAGLMASYHAVGSLIRTPQILGRLIDEMVADEASQNVVYTEPMIGPQLYADRFGWSLRYTFDFIDHHFQTAGSSHDVEVRYQLAVNWMQPDQIEKMVNFATELADHHVVAVGFTGLEPMSGLLPYETASRAAREAGLSIVPHVGELRGPRNVWESIEHLGARRIAHGIRAVEDPELLAVLADGAITCDVCLSSNVRTGAVASLQAHPLPVLLEAHVPVTINADDPLLIPTTLNTEYELVRDTWGFDDATVAGLALNGQRAAGMSDRARCRLADGVSAWLGLAERSDPTAPFTSE